MPNCTRIRQSTRSQVISKKAFLGKIPLFFFFVNNYFRRISFKDDAERKLAGEQLARESDHLKRLFARLVRSGQGTENKVNLVFAFCVGKV